MSEIEHKKPNLIKKTFAIIMALFILLMIAFILVISQMGSHENSAKHDAEVAEFLRTNTPVMTTEEQQAVVDSIRKTNAVPATPEQEQAAVNILLGN